MAEAPDMKACLDLRVAAAIALEQSRSSIQSVEDLWSPDKIQLSISPEPQTIRRHMLEEIIFRSFTKYLKRPGHVLLPGGIIAAEEFEKERGNSLLRVQKLWEYWHGSQTLGMKKMRVVSLFLTHFFH